MISSSDTETQELGQELAQKLKASDIVALHGDLGAGKTTFVKGIVQELTQTPVREVISPTFTYLHTYSAKVPVFHFDLYRIDGTEEFLKMGFLDFLQEEGISLIEWPEKIDSLLPKSIFHVEFSYLGEQKRKIDVYQS